MDCLKLPIMFEYREFKVYHLPNDEYLVYNDGKWVSYLFIESVLSNLQLYLETENSDEPEFPF